LSQIVTSLRSALLITVAVSIILVALIYSAFRLALPMVPELQEDIERRATAAIGVPVEIGSVEAEWWGFGPRLLLRDVHLLSADNAAEELMSFKALRVDISLLDLIQGEDFRPRKVRVDGAKLVIEQRANGGFSVKGFAPKQSSDGFLGPALKLLGKHGDFAVIDTEILWSRYRASGLRDYTSSQFNLSLTIRNNQYALSLNGTPPADLASHLEVQVNASGDSADPSTLAAKVFFKADRVQLASLWLKPWLDPHLDYESGIADLSAQIVWEDQLPSNIVAQTNISGLGHTSLEALDIAASASWSLPDIRQGFDHWALTVDKLSSKPSNQSSVAEATLGPLAVIQRGNKSKREYAAVIDSLDLASISQLAQRLKNAPAKPVEWLHHIQPAGLLKDTRIAFSLSQATSLQARKIDNLRVAGEFVELNSKEVAPGVLTELKDPRPDGSEKRQRGIPGFSHLSGHFEGGFEAGDIHLNSHDATLDWDFLYPDLRSFDQASGTVHWAWDDIRGMQIDWEQLDIRKQQVEIRSKGLLTFPASVSGGEPMITLTAELQNGDFKTADDFMPELLPNSVLHWMGSALLSGEIDVSFASKGTLRGFPYIENDDGQYLSKAVIRNGNLQYHPEWPIIENADLEMLFFGESMSFSGTSGSASGVQISEFSGEIPSLREGQLQIRAKGEGKAPQFVSFLKNSPLIEHLDHLITGTNTSGEADIKVTFNLPLQNIDEMQISGTITAKGVDVTRGEFDSVYQLKGPIEFTHDALSVDQLSCEFMGIACKASALIKFEEAQLAKIQATANLNIGEPGDTSHDRTLLERFVPSVVSDALHGTISMVVDLSGGADYQPTELITVHSNLLGMRDSAPAPLGLDYQETETFVAILDRRFDSGFKVNVLRDKLSSAMWFSTNSDDAIFERGEIIVGSGQAQLPSGPGLHAIIDVDYLDFDKGTEWILRDVPHRAAEERLELLPQPIESVSIASKSLKVGGQLWTNSQINLVRNGKLLDLDIQGDQVRGTVQLPNRAGLAQQQRDAIITGRFDRFYWPSPLFTNEEEASRYKPNLSPSLGLDPRLLPSARFTVDDLRFGELRLGQFVVATEPSPTGLKLSTANARGGLVTLDADGRWDRTDSGDDSFLTTSFKSGSVGQFLIQLGLEEMVNAESAVINSDFHWSSEPQQMDLRTVDGTIDLYLGRGSVEAVDPGAARLLGLFNFYSLPRRLLLDFNDVTADGFGFDKIRGSFTIVDGSAHTTDLTIKAPSANVSIIGRAGVVDRDYDQRIVVTPRVSSGLAIAGAALTPGGLGFGAALLLGQEIFGRPLENITQVRYKMIGSWDDPIITSIGGLFADGKKITTEEENLKPRRGPRNRLHTAKSGNGQSGLNSAPPAKDQYSVEKLAP
jgi:uncharacterized protein (TIGR02099 family)